MYSLRTPIAKLVVVVALLVGTLGPATPVAAGDGRLEAESALAQLERASNRDKAFSEMTPARRAAALRALTLVRVEIIQSPISYGTKRGSAAVSAASGCRGMMHTHIGQNPYGYALWRYSQTLFWCFNTDTNQVSGLSHFKSVSVNCCWWEYRGTVGDYHAGGEGQSYYYAWAQGAFTFCIAIFGCTQYAYPQVWQQITGSGGYSAGIG